MESRRTKLGAQGLEVSALGLGCMGLSAFYGTPTSDDAGIVLIHHAFNSGVTFFDTADIYGLFTNEILVGKALKDLPREKVQLATKFGNVPGKGTTVNGTPEYARKACESSLERLGVDYIDLYYQHRVDAQVPIEETMGELKRLVLEGKIKYIGLSEASADTIRRAHAVHPITAVQLEWSLWTQSLVSESFRTALWDEASSPAKRLLRSYRAMIPVSDQLFQVRQPRFQGENFEKNKVLYERVAALASKHGCTTSQLALAWVLAQGKDVVPIPGTTKVANFDENLGSLNLKLSKAEIDEIAAAVPEEEVAGTRYPEELLKRTWMFVDTPPPKA
ncbi:hypothetical protein SELMODRAFT_414970 [Selaginella moellendorffii]|uniref:NADP-dependent oxidoreductase domain-containing protein n=1 Tax=Selaginella moellendorffii TaxID=88036 RepID=D8RU65_SELML|nr:hypothetical protein SELMODRAFT_414970 [Selaginella moellendorffii]